MTDELLPSRRALLQGLGAIGAVLLGGAAAGCADDGRDAADEPSSTTTSTPSGSADDLAVEPTLVAGDLDLAIAGVTFENTTIALYEAVLEEQAVEVAAAGLVPLLERLRDHHVEHASSLNRLLRSEGLDPVPPDRLFPGVTPLEEGELVELAVPDVVALLTSREDQLTRSYIDTLSRLIDPPLRLLVATIGATEARHVAALDLEAGGVAAYLSRAAELSGGRYPIEQSLLRG